ncbi:MAG: bifunctional (p)ppGpp synthetase/guanosine-3',5'-bis(diphosphate) 3'-pyrophosphohydrolase [Alphaproteobacteria bacterium]|nr:bifunctional (p)ppGpp synthetase/guanosine-3',5'-bis(diphosphate) 3'-pyrophosphohydrolase [Alphaproteobacteria bacterium]
MMRQFELVEKVVSYDPSADEASLNRAYVYAMKMHGSQTRASGDPYYSHPVEVAGILTELKLDAGSIITALLHDTVEDTEATLEEIEKLFGHEIARLVDGVTKLTRLELTSDDSKQAENFRKLVLAMSQDIRVLLVKLADRLHNMRTLHFIKKQEKRQRIAAETLEIYAPLAERIGIAAWREELQDLAFREVHTEARESIVSRLKQLREDGQSAVDTIIRDLTDCLLEGALTSDVSGREKSPYSIWDKMKRKAVEFEQLSDIMAFRVLVDDTTACYQALGLLHAAYPLVPGRFKDYISVPKPNGYQSLHTVLIGPSGHRIEVQIRTRDMHDTAEFGVAAHWSYKDGGDPRQIGESLHWVRQLLDILENTAGADEFLEHTKLDLYQDMVFCFTPKGDLHSLPRGATPIDFAYSVHSEIGNRTVGARINGRHKPLRTVLENGDQIEIQTAKNAKPSPTWESYAVTGKAKACIRRFIRQEKRQEFMELGKAILERTFRQGGYSYSEKAFNPMPDGIKSEKLDDLYAQIGEGLTSAVEVLHTVHPEAKNKHKAEKVVPIGRAREQRKKAKDDALPIQGLIPGMAVHYAGCCHPIPGDQIVGIVISGKGVTIHRSDCDMLQQFADQPDRWIEVSWGSAKDDTAHRVSRLQATLANLPGALGSLTTVIGRNGGNISDLKFTNRTTDFFDVLIDVEVEDIKHLTNIIAALRATPAVNSVDRARG